MLESNNYVYGDLYHEEWIRGRRADAAPLRAGTGSPIVAMIGHSAASVSRTLSRIAHWAEGSSELSAGTHRRASTH